jgi:CheY-like chemotaxis protein
MPSARASVLVIDDDASIRDVLATLLRDEQYTVAERVQLPDPDEVRELRPDCIVLDIVFGGEPAGLDFLAALKRDPDLAGIPVIVCTAATGDRFELLRPRLARAAAVLAKPFNIDDLLDTVRWAVGDRPNGEAADRPSGCPL